MPAYTIDCGKIMCLICATIALCILFLGTVVGIPVGLTLGTQLNGCCTGLITLISAEVILLLGVLLWQCHRRN